MALQMFLMLPLRLPKVIVLWREFDLALTEC
jgi:transcriptional regulator